MLQDAGIKLTSVASSNATVSARQMLAALVAGERDVQVLADLAKGRMRMKIPELRQALEGRFRTEHHGVMVAQLLAHVEFLEGSIKALDERIEQVMRPFTKIRDRVMTIPGVKAVTADALIAECGVDMSRFKTAAHLASWAGLCPATTSRRARGARARHARAPSG